VLAATVAILLSGWSMRRTSQTPVPSRVPSPS
jgi:hypothetical protein